MTTTDNTTTTETTSIADRAVLAGFRFIRVLQVLPWAAIGIMLFASPTLATQGAGSGLCGTDGAPTFINGFMQLSFSIGVLGAIGMFQLQNAQEVFSIDQETKKKIKKRKSGILKGAGMLIATPLGVKYGLPKLGISVASCIKIVPFV